CLVRGLLAWFSARTRKLFYVRSSTRYNDSPHRGPLRSRLHPSCVGGIRKYAGSVTACTAVCGVRNLFETFVQLLTNYEYLSTLSGHATSSLLLRTLSVPDWTRTSHYRTCQGL